MPKKIPHKRGSPEAEIDPRQLVLLLRLKPTIRDCAAFFECSDKAIERFIRREYDMTFTEYRERQVFHTKHKLVQKAISKAMEGDNQMLIFALKNLADWTDKKEVSGTIEVNSITDLLLTADQDVLDVTPKELEGEIEKPDSD